ncbi:MAG: hypothetical protein E6J48_01695 [Chloroflexi bacterium]|nr:MAG: hypothetical protein E6J48_01695 [Chloroflexota bacterium]
MVAVGAVLCAVASVVLILALGELITHSSSGRPEAKRRAGELLRAVLTPDQYGHLMQRGHIDIASPSDPDRIYRVPKGPGRVQVREKGKLTMWLCLQPLERVPEADLLVMHKLMIEADEETYLRKANRFSPTFWEMRERPDLQ